MIFIGTKLKALRMENHLRQEQVAKLVGVDRSTVSLWESDQRQPPYGTLVRLANLYGVTTDYLLGQSDNRLLDLSGLTAAEAVLVCKLVESMTDKNRKLEDHK